MALNTGDLQTAFRGFFTAAESLPTKFDDAGAKWASLYGGYAAEALADSPQPTAASIVTQPTAASIAAAQSTMGDDLSGAFSSATSSADLALHMAGAFSAFWQAVQFQAKSETGELLATGAASNPNSPALQTKLASFFSAFNPQAQPPATAEHQADGMASLLDAWTHTVSVVNTINGQPQAAVFLK